MCGICLAFQTRPERPPHRGLREHQQQEERHDQEDSQSASFRGQYGRSLVGHGGRAVRAGCLCRRQAGDGTWDHWVPGANQGAEHRQGVGGKGEGRPQIDFITSQGNKLILTATAEAQAGRATTSWGSGAGIVPDTQIRLVPVDDIMATLVKQKARPARSRQYLGVIEGKWLGVPATPGASSRDRRHASTS